MKPYERVAAALDGDKPDRVPIMPIYDSGYLMRSAGRDIRDYIIATGEQRTAYIEENFLRHKVDGLFVHIGSTDEWIRNNTIEKHPDYWMITEKATGRRYRMLPDGCDVDEDGKPFQEFVSRDSFFRNGGDPIVTEEDITRVVPSIPTEADIDATGRFQPLRNLAQKYPDIHFSFQVGTPFIRAINACGGYVEGLVTMASEPDLFKKIMERYVEMESALIIPGRKAGARSVWYTSYYTGADTISPKTYAELVFPYEKEMCRRAKEQGLYVLYWFLGDLMPVLDKVMELPIDALVLEQGRKGYDIDVVRIREKVGKRFCLFGFGYEMDFCDFNREGLKNEFIRQFEGAGREGAFIAGTPIMPPDAKPEAVDYYFEQAETIGRY
jgi:hypothetical protein